MQYPLCRKKNNRNLKFQNAKYIKLKILKSTDTPRRTLKIRKTTKIHQYKGKQCSLPKETNSQDS